MFRLETEILLHHRGVAGSQDCLFAQLRTLKYGKSLHANNTL